MSGLDLDAIEAAARAATPGPRECRPAKRGGYRSIITVGDLSNGPGWSEATSIPMNDARFLAACSPDVILALVARVREMEADARLGAAVRETLAELTRDDLRRWADPESDEDIRVPPTMFAAIAKALREEAPDAAR